MTLEHPDIDPDRLSFSIALNTARDEVIQARGIPAEALIDLVGRIGSAVLAEVMPKRRIRTGVRVVKRAVSKYRAKTRDVGRRTYPAPLSTTILRTDPAP
ncbi:hypothetical protein DQ353_17220 [Arthrobacter sp. AQ5-05]|nr:hypothetical protein DQ353_17220 [Arthrobacter sp. AQ5-05]